MKTRQNSSNIFQWINMRCCWGKIPHFPRAFRKRERLPPGIKCEGNPSLFFHVACMLTLRRHLYINEDLCGIRPKHAALTRSKRAWGQYFSMIFFIENYCLTCKWQEQTALAPITPNPPPQRRRLGNIPFFSLAILDVSHCHHRERSLPPSGTREIK